MAGDSMRGFRMARRMGGGGARVMHPHVEQPHLVHLGGGGGGEAMPRGRIGGGVGAGFGRAGQAGARGEDAAVTGDFQRTLPIRFLGFPITGGGLTEHGKAEEADYNSLKAGADAYSQALVQGANPIMAMHAAVRAGGAPFVSALLRHPSSPLNNVTSLHNFLAGYGDEAPQEFRQVSLGGKIYNVPVSPDGSIGSPQEVNFPGQPGPAEKPVTRANLIQDAKGNYFAVTRGEDGSLHTQAVPAPGTLGPAGERAPGLITDTPPGAQPAGLAGPLPGAKAGSTTLRPSTVPGVADQVADGWHKGQIPQQQARLLEAAPAANAALQRMRENADAVQGLGRGWAATEAGKYFGINGKGAGYLQDRALVEAAGPAIMQSNYKATLEKFDQQFGNVSAAPSFEKGAVAKVQDALRQNVQTAADMAAQAHGKLAQPLENALEGMGVVSSGYQDSYLWNADPLDGAKWRLNNGVALDGAALHTLAQADASGLLRDKNDPNDLLGHRFDQVMQGAVQQRTARAQQQQASATANAQSGASASTIPTPQSVPATTADQSPPGPNREQADAGRPGGPPTTLGAEGQRMLQQPVITPQGTQSSVGQQLTPAANPPSAAQEFAPPAGNLVTGGALAQPGQPVPGMPTTNGTVPQAPPNPLPQQPLPAQNMTDVGTAPQPASATPIQPTAPQPAAQQSAAQQQQQSEEARQAQDTDALLSAGAGFGL